MKYFQPTFRLLVLLSFLFASACTQKTPSPGPVLEPSSSVSPSITEEPKITPQGPTTYLVLITDKEGGKSIVNALVSVEVTGNTFTAFTNEDGSAKLPVSSPNSDPLVRIHVEASGYAPFNLETNLSAVPGRIVLTPLLIATTIVTTTPTLDYSTCNENSPDLLYLGQFDLIPFESSDCVGRSFDATTGELLLKVTCLARWSNFIPIEEFRDFHARVITRKISGSNVAWYGFFVRSRNETERLHHRFLVSGEGTVSYEVGKFDNQAQPNGLDIIKPAMDSPSVVKGDNENEIELIREGSRLKLKVNGRTQISELTSIGENELVQVGLLIITQDTEEEGDTIEVGFKEFVVCKP